MSRANAVTRNPAGADGVRSFGQPMTLTELIADGVANGLGSGGVLGAWAVASEAQNRSRAVQRTMEHIMRRLGYKGGCGATQAAGQFHVRYVFAAKVMGSWQTVCRRRFRSP